MIEFQALDERGNQASTTLTLKIQAVAPAGRASLDQQFDRFGQAQHSQQQEQLRQQLQALAQLQQAGADQATTL